MLQRAIDFANQNPAIIGIVMCGIGIAALVILAVGDKRRKVMRKRIWQLKKAIETKEILIVHKDKEIWDLKVELFKAREDRKIAERKLQAEIEKRDARIAQLESDKKQLSKWGLEK